jgi:SAM-dependent methyltransferase
VRIIATFATERDRNGNSACQCDAFNAMRSASKRSAQHYGYCARQLEEQNMAETGKQRPSERGTVTCLVQSQFGANAANYLTSAVHAKGASLARLVQLVGAQSSWLCLDIATGAGHTAAAFAPLVKHMVASDITREMLEQARTLAALRSLTNLTTVRADAEMLPFADATFDLVTCRIAPHHFLDIPRFALEVRRVLKTGGTFALVDNIAPDEETTPGFSKAELRAAAVAYNTLEKIRDPSHGRALTTGEWIALLIDAGLTIREKERQSKAIDFADWCKNMSVPHDTASRLEAMLWASAPALRAFLTPTDAGGKLAFRLVELIVIACA